LIRSVCVRDEDTIVAVARALPMKTSKEIAERPRFDSPAPRLFVRQRVKAVYRGGGGEPNRPELSLNAARHHEMQPSACTDG
jgi:hypothetical protein